MTDRGASLSAVIVNYESGDRLHSCLRSLRAQDVPLEVVVVDNGSMDGAVAALHDQFGDVAVVDPGRNLGFAAAANAGAERATGDYLLFLNPDVELHAGCVSRLAGALAAGVAVAAPRLDVDASGTTEFGATIDPLGSPVGLTSPRRPLFVPGCALATTRDLFESLGGFDGRYFMFVEDVDYCWRALLAGAEVAVVDGAVAAHVGGGSAPGGYPAGGTVRTTDFRVVLRERNTLATLIKCYGLPRLAAVVPLYLLQSLATIAFLLAARRRCTAAAVAGGLWWNLRELPRTLARRRSVQAGRRMSDAAIARRMHPGFRKGEVFLRFRMPEVVETRAGRC